MATYKPNDDGSYTIVLGNPMHQTSPREANLNNQVEQVRYSKEMIEERMKIELMEAQVHVMQQEAIMRQMEAQLMLNGMKEFRSALEQCTVAEGDNGGISESRPPLKQILDEENAGIIQKNYVAMARRYVQFTEFVQVQRMEDNDKKE